MTTLTVTARDQVTFRRDIPEHLGIRPGDKIRLELRPDGRAELRAGQPEHAWRQLHGMLTETGSRARCSIAEIGEAIAQAGAGAGMSGLGTP